MSMINCHECKNKISSKAKVCPHCGVKPKPKTSLVTWAVLIIILIVAGNGVVNYEPPTAAQRQAMAERAEKERQEKNKPKPAEQLRQEKIEESFSRWSGAQIYLEKYIKDDLKDPESYEHIETTYRDNGETLTVKMRYRAKNSFGGYVVSQAVAETKIDGTLLSVKTN